jgi:hypothetical protein
MATYRKEDRLCESCGVIFRGRRDARYCSARCRVYASARRKRPVTKEEILAAVARLEATYDPNEAARRLGFDGVDRVPAGEE